MIVRLAACLALAAAAAPAPARTVEGVEVPDEVTAEGARLALNGVGLRRATLFKVKVYVGALYLATPSRDADAIVAADEPRTVHMTFLRDVEKDKVLGAFREGFEKNSASQARELVPLLDRIAKVIPATMKPRQALVVTYAPGKGTTVVGPEGAATVEGKPFADALLRNWLGRDPADGDLKKAMLGS
ncbi:MAG TPA: chalcone isomerase family protein [Anaeromyxobacteraceae bacterium]|nr:chalcone isomerase family protein [Anaeromyxobacteraceae bacterium]